ncbi:MAG TPA: glycoside hydrolase family 127 protein [Candidatus Marinimicrobia bacterium]|nr:glycoside hydrolase family 127 protein [Candidatus Neomarinimicrobiota bacterium]HQE94493.1 glycoside hydrolase family 127 protein [Candidatus Neomarinimicrobiota bacterium]HQK10585.1 glycoside hydrolase family 127 protein [Candidatus Neomarinimicrobiota bacterium]
MNKPNRFLCLLLLTSIPIWAETQPTFSDYPISAVDIKNVEINDAFWLPKIKIIQDTTIQYAFKKCEEEGRMENFLIAGGRKKGPVRGKMPFDDTDVYKIIEGASYSLISRPNPALAAYLDSIISIIKIGQEPDGYLTTWFTIDRMHPPAWWAQPSPNRWDHEESNHELYNSGHLFEAAAAHYRATGKQNFLKIALKNADLLVASFGPDKLRVPPGHQIVETGLIKLYHITNNPQYVELARFFLELRGDSTSHKLYGEYSQDHLPVTKQTEAVGHAVRAMYMYAGMTDIAAIYQDSAYFEALMKIWENIVTKKMYLTGGVGARHDGEAFGDNYELPNLTAYNETCAAIGSVYWNQRLFRLTGDAQYYDIIERTLYNGLISGISLDGKKFFYPNPLESDGKYQFNQGACTRQPWFDCSCCPTNIIRFLPSVPELIYATIADSVYINLYISSNADIIVNQKKIEIIQQTDYPWDGKINIIVNPEKKTIFTLKLRVPGWARNEVVPGDLYKYIAENPEKVSLLVNGKDENFVLDKGYIEITRKWTRGDKIELTLPLAVRKVVAHEKVTDNVNKVAFECGPIVYCAEEIDNHRISEITVPLDTKLNITKGAVLTENVNILRGKVDNQELILIPYYVWSNRGVGKMKVWLPINKE